MAVDEIKPRGIASIILIGLFLGPITVMLWTGRGRLALLYLGLLLLLIALLFVPTTLGLMNPVTIPGIDPSDTFSLLPLPLNVAGVAHAIWLRRTSLARPWFSRWFIALPAPLLAGVLLGFVVRAFLYQPFNIPSANMVPTLQVGDYVFVSKTAYGYGLFSLPLDIGITRRPSSCMPERGDIVVFKLPRDNQTDYIKRIIGLPGERIQMIDGAVHINGATVVKLAPETNPQIHCSEDMGCNFFRETLQTGAPM